jgi:short-subunit dehydrogenase
MVRTIRKRARPAIIRLYASSAAVVKDGTYVILGASGNTGSIIANFLLSNGEKVRVVGRDVGRLSHSCPRVRRPSQRT